MPTYLYECKNCGRFEEFQKITDEPIKECPQCGAKVKKIIGAPGIIFKGSGFYVTDYKNGKGKGKANGSSKSDGGSASAESSGSKPAPKDSKESSPGSRKETD